VPDTDPERLRAAVAAVLAHHDAFRLRFTRTENGWCQRLDDPETDDHEPTVPLEVLDLDGVHRSERSARIAAAADHLQRTLDLERGPVVRCLYVDCGRDPGRLAIAAHHLVIDGVSWRILLDDLVHCYVRTAQHHHPAAGPEPALPPTSTSYAAWSEALVASAAHERRDRDLGHWLEVVRSAGGGLPVDHQAARPAAASGSDAPASTVGSAEVVTVELGADDTARLLESASRDHHAGVEELLLAALARTLAGWCQGPDLLIDVEGHGRELPDGEHGGQLDVSRTIGWFTSLAPLRLALERAPDPTTQVRAAARSLRSLRPGAITYGILRHLHPRGNSLEPDELHRPRLCWNYLGHWSPPSGLGPFTGLATESPGRLASPLQERPYQLEVEAVIVEGRLRVDWTFSPGVHHRATITRLAEQLRGALRWLVTAAEATDAPRPGLLEDLDEDRLEQLAGVLSRLDDEHDEHDESHEHLHDQPARRR
jgi:non-ribosomal peptide synthase protein (TIGR01720 family)